jgi:hypothetical protein
MFHKRRQNLETSFHFHAAPFSSRGLHVYRRQAALNRRSKVC